MNTIAISERIDRRRFLGIAAMGRAATECVMVGSGNAQPSYVSQAGASTFELGKYTSFGSLKQIDAGVLNVGYADAGPANGPAVIFLHGWPYDIHCFVEAAPFVGGVRLLGHRPASARPWHDAFPLEQNGPEWPAGDANGAPLHPEDGAYAKKFSGRYKHRIIESGVGHNLPQEAPQAFAEAVVALDG